MSARVDRWRTSPLGIAAVIVGIAAVFGLVAWTTPTLYALGTIAASGALYAGVRGLIRGPKTRTAPEEQQATSCAGCAGCGGPDCVERTATTPTDARARVLAAMNGDMCLCGDGCPTAEQLLAEHEAEMSTAAAAASRPSARLERFLGKPVRVTSPAQATWSGQLVALADHPSLVLDAGHGVSFVLPQDYRVDVIAEDPDASGQDPDLIRTTPDTTGQQDADQGGHDPDQGGRVRIAVADWVPPMIADTQWEMDGETKRADQAGPNPESVRTRLASIFGLDPATSWDGLLDRATDVDRIAQALAPAQAQAAALQQQLDDTHRTYDAADALRYSGAHFLTGPITITADMRAVQAANERANQAEARLVKLGGRVQAIADEARGSVREWLLDALNDIPDAFHPSTAERAERAEAEAARWLAFIERGLDTHMSFGVINPDGTTEQLPCADWCHACRVERAEAALVLARQAHLRLTAYLAGFADVLDASDRGPWANTGGAALADLERALNATEGSSQ